MAHKVMMRCTTPVHDSDGVQVHKPGDLLPEGHKDIDDSPLSWAPFIVSADEPVEAPEPAVVPVKDVPVETVKPTEF